MRMCFVNSIFLVALFSVSTALAEPTRFDDLFAKHLRASSESFAELAQEISPGEASLRAGFEQSRTLSALSRPVKSEGLIIVDDMRGVLWLTRTPFRSSLILTEDGLKKTASDGSVKNLSEKEYPAVGIFVEVFMNLLKLNTSALEEKFEIYIRRGSGNWKIGLKPKAASLKRVLSAVVMTGTKRLERLEIVESQGDDTVVVFRYPLDFPGEYSELKLSADERAFFK